MRPPSDIPDEITHRAFSVADAMAAGVHRERLRRADLVKVFHGARSWSAPTSLVERAQALVPVLGAEQCFSHVTAAALLGMRLPEGDLHRRLHVTTFDSAEHGVRRPGIRGHTSLGPPVFMRLDNGLAVTPPVATWRDLGASFDVHQLVGTGDGLVRRSNPLASIDELKSEVASAVGRRGVRRLREALGLIRAGTDSWRESVLRVAIVEAGFPEPEVNGLVVSSDGQHAVHVDLLWRTARVVVEYEGRQHYEDDGQFARDLRRYDWLQEDRWDVIRVDKHLFAAWRDLFARLRRAFDTAANRHDASA